MTMLHFIVSSKLTSTSVYLTTFILEDSDGFIYVCFSCFPRFCITASVTKRCFSRTRWCRLLLWMKVIGIYARLTHLLQDTIRSSNTESLTTKNRLRSYGVQRKIWYARVRDYQQRRDKSRRPLRRFFYGNAEFVYSEKFADIVNKESFNVCNDETNFDDLGCFFFYKELGYSERSAGNVNKKSFNVNNDEADFDDLMCFFMENSTTQRS